MAVIFLGQGKVFQGNLGSLISGIQIFIYKNVWAQMGPIKCLKPFTRLLYPICSSEKLLTLVLVDSFHWRDRFKETPSSQRLE